MSCWLTDRETIIWIWVCWTLQFMFSLFCDMVGFQWIFIEWQKKWRNKWIHYASSYGQNGWNISPNSKFGFQMPTFWPAYPVSFQAAKLAARGTKQKLHKPLPARSQIRSEWPAARVIKQSGGRRQGPGVFSPGNELNHESTIQKKNHNRYPGHSRVGTWKGACRSC